MTPIIILWALGAIITASTSNPNNPQWTIRKDGTQGPPAQLTITLCALIWPITTFIYWTTNKTTQKHDT